MPDAVLPPLTAYLPASEEMLHVLHNIVQAEHILVAANGQEAMTLLHQRATSPHST